MTTKIVFNGDTAAGRAQWVPWLRSIELELDEWAWAVLQDDVLPHGKLKELMEKLPASRTALYDVGHCAREAQEQES